MGYCARVYLYVLRHVHPLCTLSGHKVGFFCPTVFFLLLLFDLCWIDLFCKPGDDISLFCFLGRGTPMAVFSIRSICHHSSIIILRGSAPPLILLWLAACFPYASSHGAVPQPRFGPVPLHLLVCHSCTPSGNMMLPPTAVILICGAFRSLARLRHSSPGSSRY